MSDWIFRVLCVLAACLALQAPGQVEGIREVDRREDRGGLTRGVYRYSENRMSSQAAFLEVQLNHPQISTDLLIPEEGPHQQAMVRDMAPEAAASLAIDAPADHPADGIRGLILSGRSLYAWPPEGPQLVIAPEGRGAIINLEPGSAWLITEEDERFPLTSINGPLPQDPGGISLYTGAISFRHAAAALWPDDVQAAVIRPVSQTSEVHELFLTGGADVRQFAAISDFRAKQGFLLQPGEAALLTVPPIEATLAEIVQSRTRFSIEVELDNKVQFARTVFPLTELAISGAEPLGSGRRFQNAVALSEDGTRLLWLTKPSRTGAGRNLSVSGVAAFLEDEGFSELALLPDGLGRMVFEPPSGSGPFAPGAGQTGLLLRVRRSAPELTLGDRTGSYTRVRPSAITGTIEPFSPNRPVSAGDLRAGYSPELDQFWAARSDPEEPATLRFTFTPPRNIAALDVLHAENSGFSPQFNAKSFRLLARKDNREEFEEIAAISNPQPTARNRVVFDEPIMMSELVIEITEPNFFDGGDVVRLAEVMLWTPAEE